MNVVNSVVGAVIELALYPFRGLPPIVGLTVFSLISGVGMLYVFKWTSDQDRIAEVKRKIHAGIFEIRLFNDDMRAILAAQRDILRYNVSYVRLSLVPLVWMIVPFVLVVAQLQFHYGYESIDVGEPAIIKVSHAEGAAASLELEVPEGVRLDSPPVRIPRLNEVDWRIVATEPGEFQLGVRVGSDVFSKTLTVGPGIVRRSPFRVSSFLDQVLYPVEPRLPADAPVATIEVMYRDGTIDFFGWDTHWLVPFFIITIVLAFALRKPLGVTF